MTPTDRTGPRDSSPPTLQGGGPRRSRWSTLMWVALGILLLAWVWGPLSGAREGARISYTDFRQQLEAGNVAKVVLSGDEIVGELRAPANLPAEGRAADGRRFVTWVPSIGDEQLMADLRAQGVEVHTEPERGMSWLLLLLNVLPFLLLIWLGFLLVGRMRSQGQNVFSMGKSRAKAYQPTAERTVFADVAGAAGAKGELEEVVEFLRNPHRFQRLGGEIPRGILLVGPPGTGKTLLARAVAGEANVPFYSITGSDFMEMLVGVGASRVRDLFREAKANAPAIIFIDELDSIGRRRGAGLGGGHDEREQTLNQLLSEMDGFDTTQGVLVMAATNRPDILDPALLRPGRFDRQVVVDLPTMADRAQILAIHARNKPLAPDVDLEEVARSTPGFSGAALKNLLNEAALLAARERKDVITRRDIDDARDKILMGLERENLALTDEEIRMLAYHEGGHALLAAVLPEADPLHKVTIVPRGRAMGVTEQLPERDKYIYSRAYMLDRLAVMMGGRAAEDLVFEQATSGAENDLKQATRLARKMVMDWGMSDRLGHMAVSGNSEHVFLGEDLGHTREYSEATAREIDTEVKRILEEAYDRAVRLLEAHREGLDAIAEALIAHEVISGSMVFELLGLGGNGGRPEPREAARRLQ